jgi:hypothetical protein
MQLIAYSQCESQFDDFFKTQDIIRPDNDIEVNTPSAWLINLMDLENGAELPNRFLSSNTSLLIIQADLESINTASNTGLILEQLHNHTAVSQIHLLVNSEIQKTHILKSFPNLNISLFNTWEIYTRKFMKITAINKTQEQRRFLYLNRRCSPERLYLFNLLWRNNFFKNQSYSSFNKTNYWSNQHEPNQYYQDILREIQNRSGLEHPLPTYKFPKLPACFSDRNPYKYSMYNENLQSAYRHTDISVITESQPADDQELFFPTEKTFRAIALKHPFIIYGQQNFYQNLKNLGYKTFDSLWDESFDKIADPWQRAKQIRKVINKLTVMSNSDFENLINKTKSIVEHNHKTFFKRTDTKTIVKRLDSRIQHTFSSFDTKS